MARHVICTHDKWPHDENAECPCNPEVIFSAVDGDMIYVHSDLTKVNGPNKEDKNVEVENTQEKNRIANSVIWLEDLHDNFMYSAFEDPNRYSPEFLHHVNNGILSRLEVLMKRKFYVDNNKILIG